MSANFIQGIRCLLAGMLAGQAINVHGSILAYVLAVAAVILSYANGVNRSKIDARGDL